MARLAWLLSVIIGGVAVAYAPPASGLRCGNELVERGDYAYQVRRACGPPTAVEPLHSAHHYPDRPREARWYYDRGPNRLLRVLHVRGGRVRRIETRDHGLAPGAADGQCDPYAIHEGMSSYRLLRLCGAPLQRSHRRMAPEHLHEHHGHWADKLAGAAHGEAVVVEAWLYPFGDRYLDRRVRLIRGEVVAVDTAD